MQIFPSSPSCWLVLGLRYLVPMDNVLRIFGAVPSSNSVSLGYIIFFHGYISYN